MDVEKKSESDAEWREWIESRLTRLEGSSNQFWWTVGFAVLLTCLLLFGK
jgi:type IV secretory pathway component VirB8